MSYLVGIALGMWLVVFPAAVVGLLLWSARRDKAWEAERPTWADDPTPTYDALCFEFWEREVSK